MNDFETCAEGIRLIKQFEGAPRLVARKCEGDAWELGYGCTTLPPNGRKVRPGEAITDAQVDWLLAYHLREKEAIVRRLVTRPLNLYQFSALVALVFNIGEDNFRTSSVLREVNAGNFENAAANFCLFVKATSAGPDKTALADPERYGRIISEDKTRWIGPQGQPCLYMRGFLGLLRRHDAEGCLFSGYDWNEATIPDSLRLSLDRQWEPEHNRWHDRVRWNLTTPFKDVLLIAKKYPLPPLNTSVTVITDVVKEDPLLLDKPAPPPVLGDAQAEPDAGEGAATGATQPTPLPLPPLGPAPTIKDLPPPPKRVDVSRFNVSQIRVDNGVKPMEYSDRAVGFAIKMMGMWIKILAGRGSIPLMGASIYFELFADPFITASVIAVVVWTFGQFLVWVGNRKRNKHLKSATTVLT